METGGLAERFGKIVTKYVVQSGIRDDAETLDATRLANKLGLSADSVSEVRKVMKGTAGNPNTTTIARYFKVLGVSDEDQNYVLGIGRESGTTFSELVEAIQASADFGKPQTNEKQEIRDKKIEARLALRDGDLDRANALSREIEQFQSQTHFYARKDLELSAENLAKTLAFRGSIALQKLDFAEAVSRYSQIPRIDGLTQEVLQKFLRPISIAFRAQIAAQETLQDARAVFQEMAENGVTPDVFSYTTLLTFLKTEEEARAVFQEMAENGVTPDVFSYTTLLTFLKTEEEARAVFQEMAENGVTPNVVSYTTLLTFLKMEEEVRAVFQEMAENGVTPNVVSYTTLLTFLKTEEEVRAVFQEMAENGVTPNVVSYNTLLTFLKTEEEARAVFQEMAENGVTPDVFSYTTLLTFLKTEEEVRAIFQKMAENGVTPDVFSYTTLLTFLKTEEEVRAIFQEMAENGVTPDVFSYTTLLTFLKTEEEVRAVFQEMAENGVTPNEITVVTGLKRCGSFEQALMLADWCIERRYFVGRGSFEAVYSFPVSHLSAQALLGEYDARTFRFDTSLGSPINQYRGSSQPEQALQLLMVAPHIGPAQRFYREDYDLCRSYLEAELEAGNDEDNLHYAYGIAAALNEDWEPARRHLEIALERCFPDAHKRRRHIQGLINEVTAASP